MQVRRESMTAARQWTAFSGVEPSAHGESQLGYGRAVPVESRVDDPAAWRSSSAEKTKNSLRSASLRQQFKAQFSELARSPGRFRETLQQVFGNNLDIALAEQYRLASLQGNFDWLSEARLVDSRTLGGARGAFDSESGQILLNGDFSDSELSLTYMEEAGHFLDHTLNHGLDSVGDEGEIFCHVLSGAELSVDQLAAAREENDHGTIVVDGRKIDVEFGFFKSIGKAFKSIGKKLSGLFSGNFMGLLSFALPGWGTIARFAISTVVQKLSKKLAKKRGLFGTLLGAAFNFIGSGTGSVFNSLGSFGALGGKLASVLPAPINGLLQRGTDIFRTVAGTARELGRDAVGIFTDGASEILGGLSNGVAALGRGEWGKAAKSLFSAPIDGVVRTIGGFVDAGVRTFHAGADIVATLLGQPPARTLTPEEIGLLRQVYGEAIPYADMTIRRGGITDWFGMSAHVIGRTVYLPAACFGEHGTLNELGKSTLFHEAFHVWQNEHTGGDYIHKSLLAQLQATLSTGSRNGAYDWRAGVSGHVDFLSLNPEQQAALMEEVGRAVRSSGSSAIARGDFHPPLTDPQYQYVLRAWDFVRR